MEPLNPVGGLSGGVRGTEWPIGEPLEERNRPARPTSSRYIPVNGCQVFSSTFFVLGRVAHVGTFWQLMLYGLIGAVFATYLQRRKAKKAAEEHASE